MKHLSDAPLYGRLLALPTNIRLGLAILARDKHSSLLPKFVNYGQKSFITSATGLTIGSNGKFYSEVQVHIDK